MLRNLWVLFKFQDGDGGGGGGAAPVAGSGTTPPAPPSSPSPPPSTPSPAAASPGTTPPLASAGAASQPAPSAAPSWLDGLRTAGVPVGKDEQETISTLRRIHEERQALESIRHLVPHLGAYQQHAPKFMAWLAEQQKAQAPAQQGDKPWYAEMWSPPEYNPAWERQIQRDANGNLVPAQGAPPDVVLKYQQYQAFRQEQAEKFMSNPMQYMEGAIDKRAEMIASRIIEQRMQEVQDRQAAQGFVQSNQSWLYELDDKGMPKMQFTINPQTGQPVQTPVLGAWGKRFTEYLQKAQSMGLPSIQAQTEYAQALLQRDYYQANPTPAAPTTPAAPPVTPQQTANNKFLDRNNPPAPTAGGRSGNVVPADKKVTRKNLGQVLRDNLQAAGFNDQTLKN